MLTNYSSTIYELIIIVVGRSIVVLVLLIHRYYLSILSDIFTKYTSRTYYEVGTYLNIDYKLISRVLFLKNNTTCDVSFLTKKVFGMRPKT